MSSRFLSGGVDAVKRQHGIKQCGKHTVGRAWPMSAAADIQPLRHNNCVKLSTWPGAAQVKQSVTSTDEVMLNVLRCRLTY